MPTPEIDVVLLDIGGVLVELGGVPGLRRLLDKDLSAEEIHDLWAQSEAVLLHETGKISAKEFSERLVGEMNIPLAAPEFLKRFIEWPTRLHPGAKAMIEAIPARYRTSALSNTSQVHWERCGTEFELDGAFTHHYFSHELGYMKPDPQIYQAVLEHIDAPAERILFLDDSPRNVTAARALGIEAQLAEDTQGAIRVLKEFEILP